MVPFLMHDRGRRATIRPRANLSDLHFRCIIDRRHIPLTADRGGFYLASLTLTPVNLSEGWFGTDPLTPFADGHTVADGAEVGLTNGTIEHGSSDGNGTWWQFFHPNTDGWWSDPTSVDTDGDGLHDGNFSVGNEARGEGFYGTDPARADSDGDGLVDGDEVFGWGDGRASDPQMNDTDNDGACDGYFTLGFPDMPSATNWNLGERRNGTEPLKMDTDQDGIPDGWELRYGYNASDAADATFTDACNAGDFDCADNLDEYLASSNSSWNLTVNGVWWNGTDPLRLDTDGDTMPDGWELYFGLNATSAADKLVDADQDQWANYLEYSLSIVNSSWNSAHCFYPWLSLDPTLNDTDGDTIDDHEEMYLAARKDPDGDGVASAADEDSDGDGLWDIIEVTGWEVGVAHVQQLQLFMDPSANVTSDDFSWSNVTSDPYLADTDNDTVGDLGEYYNSSNPRDTDTDDDFVPDGEDWVFDSLEGANVSLSTVQDVEPPRLNLDQWYYHPEDCWLGGKKYACANVTIRVNDLNGVRSLTFRNVATRNVQEYRQATFGSNISVSQGFENITGWILLPLLAGSSYNGEFQFLVHAEDWVGNIGEGFYFGGGIYLKWKETVDRVDTVTLEKIRRGDVRTACYANEPTTATGNGQGVDCIKRRAMDIGTLYSFDMAAHQGNMLPGLSMESQSDFWNGYSTLWGLEDPLKPGGFEEGMWELYNRTRALRQWTDTHNGSCDALPSWEELDKWVTYVQTRGILLNPFEPTFDDQLNLSAQAGIETLYCQAENDLQNASNFVVWLKGVYDGLGQGGILYLILTVVPTLVVPVGAAGNVGKAAVGAKAAGLAERAAARAEAGSADALLTGEVAVARAALKEAPTLGTELASTAGEILAAEGGAVAKAARGAEQAVKVPKVLELLTGTSRAELGHIDVSRVVSGYARLVERRGMAATDQWLSGFSKGKALEILDARGVNMMRFREVVGEETWAQVASKWAAGKGRTLEESILEHYRKWGVDETLTEFTDNANAFWNSNKAAALWGKWNAKWAKSYRIDVGTFRGYYTSDGRVYTLYDKTAKPWVK